MVASLPLKGNDEVRAATRSPRIFASTFSSSSARPSEKYSSSSSRLRFTNGSTAIETRSAARPLPVRRAPCRGCAGRSRTSSADWERARGIFSRQRLDDPLQLGGQVGADARGGVGTSRRIAEAHVGSRRPGKGPQSRRELVEDDAQREQIGPRVDALPAQLLRRHVRIVPRISPAFEPIVVSESAFEACDDLREAEIQHLQPAIARHHHVSGLEIAVDHAAFVRGDQGVGEGDGKVEQPRRAGRRERPGRRESAPRAAPW